MRCSKCFAFAGVHSDSLVAIPYLYFSNSTPCSTFHSLCPRHPPPRYHFPLNPWPGPPWIWNTSSMLHGPVKSFNQDSKEDEYSLSAEVPNQKLLKVAIFGRPNAGKSTLINQIVQTNVCDVSSKIHTTQFATRTAFKSGNTQLLFVDTPGLVTKKEISKFNLSESYNKWKTTLFDEVDIIGLIVQVQLPSFRIHSNLIKSLELFAKQKPVFLIVNKIDTIKNSEHLRKLKEDLENFTPHKTEESSKRQYFTKVFLVSALKNKGVSEVVEYLLGEAKEGNWVLDSDQICDTPLNLLIINLLRAKMMNLVPNEIPYLCRYEIEYLKENSLGEIVCVALVSCRVLRHQQMIINKRKKSLKYLCMELESDLYNILKRTVRLRVVVTSKHSK